MGNWGGFIGRGSEVRPELRCGNSLNRVKVGEGRGERGRGPSWRAGLTILSPMLFHITIQDIINFYIIVFDIGSSYHCMLFIASNSLVVCCGKCEKMAAASNDVSVQETCTRVYRRGRTM